MKWRNQSLAIFCLFAFAALGVFYFRNWVVQKPFGIVLFIGEGLTPSLVTVTRLYLGGADTGLAIDSMPFMALLSNQSRDFAVPDQAAAATALATGTKANNRSIGLDANGKALRNIIELAKEKGRVTGLVTNTRLTDVTMAGFYAHTGNQEDSGEIARQLIEEKKFDVALGGGAAAFLTEGKGGSRRDGRDLLFELRRDGFDVVRSKAELEAIPGWRRPKVFGVFSNAEMAFANELAFGSEQPALPDMVRRGIELLQFNPGGYLLVVDAGLMRIAAQLNNGERTLSETVELDRAVAVAQRYVGRKSTILVTGDCGVGGLSLHGFPFRRSSGIALLGLNASGEPSITWASGPNGTRVFGAATLAPRQSSNGPETAKSRPNNSVQEPAAIFALSALNTAEDVVVVGSGPGTEALHGFMDNTSIFEIIRNSL